ncbi:MAG TPA: ABC transporter ATP-binding protein [Lachnospiraceae bacterium]|nr:ABC transporter ATP-binding protein [Lachnospiraceae bacterium]
MKHSILSVVSVVGKKYVLFTIGLAFVIISSIVVGILPPLVLERIVNNLTQGTDISGMLIVIYVILLIAAGTLDCCKEGMITIFGQKVTHGLRKEMSRKLIRLPAAFFVENETGMVTSRFVNDVDTVENLFTSGVISLAADICKVLSILVIIFIKSRGLGILMLIVLPLLFLMSFFIQKKMLKAQKQNRMAVARANNHIPETISNFQMIQTYHAEGFFKRKYTKYIEDGFQSMEKSNFYDAIYSPVVITVSAVVVAVMMVCATMGSGMMQLFGISVGTAVAVISYISKVFEPIESIGMEIQNIQSAVAGISRVNEFLQEEERYVPTKVSFTKVLPAVSFENVYFGYEKNQEILDGYSFQVSDGENVTLMGRTGIGKSTTFKLILGLYTPWSGTVSIFGVSASQMTDQERACLIGYVEQSFHMISGTIKEQVTLKDKTISDKQVENALRMVGLWETISQMEKGYDTDCTPALFSQGQMQLLSIARAVVKNPPILLLDEITANLDSETELKVLKALDKASESRTVISISHRVHGIEEQEMKGTIQIV